MERDSSTHCLPYYLGPRFILSIGLRWASIQGSTWAPPHIKRQITIRTTEPQVRSTTIHYWSARKGWAPTIFEAPTAGERCPTSFVYTGVPDATLFDLKFLRTNSNIPNPMQQVYESIHALAYSSLPMQDLDTSATPMSRMDHARATYDNSLVLGRATYQSDLWSSLI